MEKNLSIAEDLYIIGVINALTGYYSLYYKNNEDKVRENRELQTSGITASNAIVLKSGKLVKSTINVISSSEIFIISTKEHSNPGLKSEEYTGDSDVPYDKEINIVSISVIGSQGEITSLYVEKHYDDDNFYSVLNKDASYEEKQRFLLETLDKKGRRAFRFPNNREINPNKKLLCMSEADQFEIHQKATTMSSWLASKVKQEKEAKKLVRE